MKYLITVIVTNTYEKVVEAATREDAENMASEDIDIQNPENLEHSEVEDAQVRALPGQ